jgi:hypothetical protein
VRTFPTACVVLALLVQASYAQQSMPDPPSLSAIEKGAIVDREAAKKAADDSYQATIKRIPDAKQKVDPWAIVRSPASK